MRPTPALIALALVSPVLVPAAGAQGSFQGLGDLAGGVFASGALAVSADGRAVAGSGISGSGPEAFLWTEAGGLVGLNDFPGGSHQSRAFGVSNSEVVVGYGQPEDGWPDAFRWTSVSGLQRLADLAAPGTEEIGSEASAISADGLVAVGIAMDDDGTDRPVLWPASGGVVQITPELAGHTGGYATGVSSDGQVVVGTLLRDAGGGQAFRWNAGSMQGLGDLAGGSVSSGGLAVSGDGAVVVGTSSSAAGPTEAFRWTQAGGMQPLGDLAGGQFLSYALGVSGDGSVVVGEGRVAAGQAAFIWTAAGGIRSLQDSLVALGVDMTGWTLLRATAISSDGSVIVGVGLNPQGQPEAWRADLSALSVTVPGTGDIVVSGERTWVHWIAPASLGLLELVLLPDTLGAVATVIQGGLVPAAGVALWTAPDMSSRSARLVLRVTADHTIADTTGFFRIKPYHLTRLVGGGAEYERFQPMDHGWNFANTLDALFPPEWHVLPQFDYFGGPDPFTQSNYDPALTVPPVNGRPNVFADWPAYVRAFGTDAAYHLVVPFVNAWYRDSFVAAWGMYHGGRRWRGSCSGMAVSSLLAFGHREAFGARYPDIGPVERLFTIGMSPPVRELANTLYAYWPGLDQRQHRQAIGFATRTPRQILADLKNILLNENRSGDGYLYISSGVAGGGAHAVVPYGLRRDPAGQGRWRVLIYDPNRRADATAVVLLDSLANQWSYAGGFNWSGSTGMYVMDPVTNYLGVAVPAGAVPLDAAPARGSAGGSTLYVAVAPGADVTLASAAGSIGYADGAVFNTLPGASPDVPPVGGPTPPIGYEVPAGPYALTMSAFPDSAAAAYILASTGVVMAFGRADADSTQSDVIHYDPSAGLGGRLTATSVDPGVVKRVTLRAIVPGTDERTLDVADLGLSGADSVRFTASDDPAGPRLRLENPGGAKSYTLRLRRADPSGGARFRHLNVPLAAGATHTVRPDWATLGVSTVEVHVDLNGDGIPDEVLVLENQPVAAEPGAPPAGGAPALALHPPMPNPATGRATIQYELPAAGRVRLAVYDALGREVAVIIDGERPAGPHEAVLEAGALAPGFYIARLTAGGREVARTLTVRR